MAKIVTLKSPSDEDIYPVTDASGIRVTGNITLQQALDGFVYADDPTAPANPDGWITSGDVDWSNFGSAIKKFSMPAVSNTSAGSWTSVQLGSAQNVSGLDPNGSYIIIAVDPYAESIGAVGEFRLEATGTTTVAMNSYHSDSLESVSFLLGPVKPKSTGVLTFKRYYRGDTATVRCSTTEGVIIRVG